MSDTSKAQSGPWPERVHYHYEIYDDGPNPHPFGWSPCVNMNEATVRLMMANGYKFRKATTTTTYEEVF